MERKPLRDAYSEGFAKARTRLLHEENVDKLTSERCQITDELRNELP